MGKRIKVRLPRLLRLSLGSCRHKNFSDVKDTSLVTTQTYSFRWFFPTICLPRRSKVSKEHSPLFRVTAERQITSCPPASPVFPSPNQETLPFGPNDGEIRNDLKKRRKSKRGNRRKSQVGTEGLFGYEDAFEASTRRFKSGGSWCWSSSDKEEEEEEEEDEDEDDVVDTFFSSRSFSLDSSISRPEDPKPRLSKATAKPVEEEETDKREGELKQTPGYPLNKTAVAATSDSSGRGGEVEGSFAVVKRSKDPYKDFQTSMVEMIAKSEMLAAADLEHLLRLFLSLNSRHHHTIIIQVFFDIYHTLFSR